MPRRVRAGLGGVVVVTVLVAVATLSPEVTATAGAAPGAPASPRPGTGPMRPAPAGAVVGNLAQGSRPVQLSTNWSGYAATSPTTFTAATSDFVQPSIRCTGAPGTYMAAWVGLDGFKNQTVEQDGTFATCTGRDHKVPTYVAWYEMFPAGSVELFPVNAGDEIQPAVTFAGGRFTLSITDATTGQSGSFTAACRSCRRASAEWIVERPELCTRGGRCFLSSLPDFATAALSSDTAQTHNSGATPLSSFTNTPIDMVQPKGTSVELLDQSGPLDNSGTGFSVTWERTGKHLPV